MTDSLTFVSSDGHATARMKDFRPYLESHFHEEFDAFVLEYEVHGSRNFDPPTMRRRTDPEVVEEWITKAVEPGRLDGCWDPDARLLELERLGIAAEVIFPDFGHPFELYSPSLATALGYPPRTEEQLAAGFRAWNRWVADFCSVAPERFSPMGEVSWNDVEAAVRELHWMKEHGFGGVVLPVFEAERPVFAEEHEPIWNTLEELELIVNSHGATSGTGNVYVSTRGAPHQASTFRLWHARNEFYSRELLSHMIWGGVLERHPGLTFVLTEQGSSWTAANLRDMDFAYEGSYLRRDLHEVITLKPSEYFSRQCYLGSSLLSAAEVEGRHQIGLDKMMVGADYPHHEGFLLEGTVGYLRATFGAANVPEDETKKMLSETACKVFGFDPARLPTFKGEGELRPEVILTPPDADVVHRGDLVKPFI